MTTLAQLVSVGSHLFSFFRSFSSVKACSLVLLGSDLTVAPVVSPITAGVTSRFTEGGIDG